ncbi:hypothetical protein EXU57_08325 [Segetibacter sp. 3557_3]|uniref:hypothetical protein n=1 Tax=Segetibacter sp. 3557_3 TaxID=2547429 RepID=UPI001058B3A7|nr:hypothetical protein [Segetibacter sp. 3557_3]TDH26807.1 hypothetical protein EXU57_08325 [Segetibacter sp. 3557_3]
MSHYQLPDDVLIDSIKDCSLDPAVFTHEAHLRLAWLQIQHHGIDQAIVNVCLGLKQFVLALGAEDKYNETLTVSAVRAVYHFMLKSPATDFRQFITENNRLKQNFPELMGKHYSENIFVAERAKKVYLEPDLLPFD